MGDEEEEIKRSLTEEGRVFHQSKLEEFRYNASFELIILSNHDMDISVLIDYVDGLEKGNQYVLNIHKRDKQFIIMLKDSKPGSRPFSYQSRYFLELLNSQQKPVFQRLLDEMELIEERKRVEELYEKEAESVLDEAFINYCLDNRLFERLEEYMKQGDSSESNLPIQ
ncbi:hypothetical protein [Rossellomorea marisflavi]|uniref:hypothetical protein n=1 Tax=Rossellomorea marisflavi TaxID=189381 RepID=UPI003FA01187